MTMTSRKADCTIITTCIIATVVVISCIIAPSLLLTRPIYTTKPITTQGPELIKLDSSVISIIITLIEPKEAQINALLTSNKPTEHRELSGVISKSQRNGPFPYVYNYNGGDVPIYLFAGSKLIYILFVTGITTSSCPARLYLFKNRQAYENFKNGYTNSFDNSSCLFPAPHNQTWSFEITITASYYAGIYIGYNTSVFGYISVEHVFYNTADFDKQNYCSEQLSVNNNPYCKVTICQKALACNDQYYLLVNSTSNIIYTKREEQFFSKKRGQIATLSVALIVLVVVIISSVLICICVCWSIRRNSSDKTVDKRKHTVSLPIEDKKEFIQYRNTSKYSIDIPTLMNLVVAEIPGEWQNVATQLGIGPNQLDGIKKNTSYGGDPKEFFRAVLEQWEANQTRFNWCTMLSILSSSSINEEKLAHKIASQLQDNTVKEKIDPDKTANQV